MALGTQQPMDSFLGKNTGNNEKNQQRGKGITHQQTNK